MKIRYFSRRVILYHAWGPRKPKILTNFVHDHPFKRKSNFFQKFDFIWKSLNAFQIKSFCLVFPLSNPSINTKQVHKTRGGNPSPIHSPHFAKNFHKLLKIRILSCSHSQPKPSIQTCSRGSQESETTLARSQSIQDRVIPLSPVWNSLSFDFLCFMHH